MKQPSKTTKEDFDLFVKECKNWVEFLELNRWDIQYIWKSGKNDNWCNAGCRVYRDATAEIFFDTEWQREDKTVDNIKISAKHEVLHVLLGRMKDSMFKRFVSEDEMLAAEEEVVRLLCKKLKI